MSSFVGHTVPLRWNDGMTWGKGVVDTTEFLDYCECWEIMCHGRQFVEFPRELFFLIAWVGCGRMLMRMRPSLCYSCSPAWTKTLTGALSITKACCSWSFFVAALFVVALEMVLHAGHCYFIELDISPPPTSRLPIVSCLVQRYPPTPRLLW